MPMPMPLILEQGHVKERTEEEKWAKERFSLHKVGRYKYLLDGE